MIKSKTTLCCHCRLFLLLRVFNAIVVSDIIKNEQLRPVQICLTNCSILKRNIFSSSTSSVKCCSLLSAEGCLYLSPLLAASLPLVHTPSLANPPLLFIFPLFLSFVSHTPYPPPSPIPLSSSSSSHLFVPSHLVSTLILMASNSRDGPPLGDNILLLPSSQATTPSMTTASSFQDENSLNSSSFNPLHAQNHLTPHSNNNNNITSSPSVQPLAIEQQAVNSFSPLRSTSSISSRSSTSSSSIGRSGGRHGPFSSTAADTLTAATTQPIAVASSSVSATAHAGEGVISGRGRPAKDSPYSANREHGSKASQLLHTYILTPFQSLQLYLSTSTRDRGASASTYHPAVRKLPPWLLPHYRGRKPVIRSTVLRPLCRLLLLAVILAVLIVSTLFYSFREGQPELSDYGALTEFNWTPINPRSYLSPMNASFGENYDVLLDGHSHSTYSDGRMSPETLLKWHIGE